MPRYRRRNRWPPILPSDTKASNCCCRCCCSRHCQNSSISPNRSLRSTHAAVAPPLCQYVPVPVVTYLTLQNPSESVPPVGVADALREVDRKPYPGTAPKGDAPTATPASSWRALQICALGIVTLLQDFGALSTAVQFGSRTADSSTRPWSGCCIFAARPPASGSTSRHADPAGHWGPDRRHRRLWRAPAIGSNLLEFVQFRSGRSELRRALAASSVAPGG